jgi:energy-coupling factor transporter ATP-binding protein EcfA2
MTYERRSGRNGGNVLLLDEPTNDLDTETLSALEDALENFAGCAVIISHDRMFLDRMATHILAFEGRQPRRMVRGQFRGLREGQGPPPRRRRAQPAQDDVQAADQVVRHRPGCSGIDLSTWAVLSRCISAGDRRFPEWELVLVPNAGTC